jgi:hypothetical protein
MSQYEWRREQLTSAGVDEETRTDVLALLAVWERIVFTADDPRKEKVLTTFTDLARNIAIEKDDPAFEWLPATRVKPRQNDRIRIVRDAFPGERGRELNGKEGIVARISRGTLVMQVDGAGSVHVHPDLLEARVPKSDLS